MPADNTRQAILTYLASHPLVTTSEMALDLGVGAADIRYHITRLINEKQVDVAEPPLDRQRRRGKPERYLRLATELQDNNYQALASVLLVLAQTSHQSDKAPIELSLAKALTTGVQLARNMPRRLAYAIQFLHRNHYAATWEARIQGPRILFHNCPYAAIWPDHLFLCQMDKLLLETLTGLKVDSIETILPDSNHRPACIFQARLAQPRT